MRHRSRSIGKKLGSWDFIDIPIICMMADLMSNRKYRPNNRHKWHQIQHQTANRDDNEAGETKFHPYQPTLIPHRQPLPVRHESICIKIEPFPVLRDKKEVT